jgi:hypothetical protein
VAGDLPDLLGRKDQGACYANRGNYDTESGTRSRDAILKDAASTMQKLDVGMLTDRDITLRATAQGRDPTKNSGP